MILSLKRECDKYQNGISITLVTKAMIQGAMVKLLLFYIIDFAHALCLFNFFFFFSTMQQTRVTWALSVKKAVP